MAKLSKDKVKAMLPKDMIVVPCDNAPEVDSAFETAKQARSEMGDRGASVKDFKIQCNPYRSGENGNSIDMTILLTTTFCLGCCVGIIYTYAVTQIVH